MNTKNYFRITLKSCLIMLAVVIAMPKAFAEEVQPQGTTRAQRDA